MAQQNSERPFWRCLGRDGRFNWQDHQDSREKRSHQQHSHRLYVGQWSKPYTVLYLYPNAKPKYFKIRYNEISMACNANEILNNKDTDIIHNIKASKGRVGWAAEVWQRYHVGGWHASTGLFSLGRSDPTGRGL